jgi:hypothetical protein
VTHDAIVVFKVSDMLQTRLIAQQGLGIPCTCHVNHAHSFQHQKVLSLEESFSAHIAVLPLLYMPCRQKWVCNANLVIHESFILCHMSAERFSNHNTSQVTASATWHIKFSILFGTSHCKAGEPHLAAEEV